MCHELDEDGVAVELGELAAQDEEVEAFGVLVVVANRGRQPCEREECFGVLVCDACPGVGVGVLLHGSAVGADDEVVEVHPGDDLVQCRRGGRAEIGLRVAESGDEAKSCFEEPLRQ